MLLKTVLSLFHQATELAIIILDRNGQLEYEEKNPLTPVFPKKLIKNVLEQSDKQTIKLINLPKIGHLSFFVYDDKFLVIWQSATTILANGPYDNQITVGNFKKFAAQVKFLYMTLYKKIPTINPNHLDLDSISFINKPKNHIYNGPSHAGYQAEQKMLLGVEHGNISEFNYNYQLFMNSGNFGTLANSSIRSKKNLTIAATTLFTRAAIRGGMPAENAYNLSDSIIKETEQQPVITNIYEFTRKIGERFLKNVANYKHKNFPVFVYKAQIYIYENLNSIKSIKEIADFSGCSSSYLMHIFKQTTGKPIFNFINDQRIKTVKQMLIFTNNTLEEISSFMGYGDQSQLSHQFKQAAGCTPSQFRKQYQL